MPRKLTFEEQIERELTSRMSFEEQVNQELIRRSPGLYQRQQAAEQSAREQAELEHAHGVIESSPLPGLRALTTQVGAGLVSLGARISGQEEVADRFNRFGAAIEQAARERDERSILPEIVSRGIRGAGVSMGTMIPAGMIGGPYGAIAAASMQETNRAITEGRDAGKKGRDLAEYAIVQGVVEAVPAAIMQKVGLGGVESIFGKKSVSLGLKEGFKRMGITMAQELPEELVTEVSHSIVTSLAGVDPNATSPERLMQTIADTTMQTFIATAFMGAPGVVRSVKAGQVARTTEEMTTFVREGTTPTRGDWRRWGLTPESGRSRKQRRAFIQEVVGQVETMPPTPVEEAPSEVPPVALEGPEAAVAPPAGAVEPAVAPEVPEVAPEPEAVTEAPGAFSPGEPMLVYRGRKTEGVGGVVYFTPHKNIARDAFAGGKSEDVEASYVTLENPLIVSSSAMENANIDGTVEFAKSKGHDGLITPDFNDEYAQIVAFSESQIQEAPGAIKTAPDDQDTALSKVGGARIRELINRRALSEEAVQSFNSVMERVITDKADHKALDIAAEALETGRQITAYEHTAMVLKADKLLSELEIVQRNQGEAARTGNEAAHKQAMAQEKNIVDQLDELTAATRYSRREIARALSIGRLRLSRENFDVANILDRMRATKGPGEKLTDKEKKLAARLSKEHATKIRELEQVTQEIRDAEEARDKAIAEKVLAVNKPRKKIGRGIRERARAEREGIKEQIRQMGMRVNDITGVSAEGLYLIGRLGITYIKEGAGTLVEVAENLRRDMPDLNLSQHDVNQALIARSPKEKVRARSEAIKRVTKLKSMARMEVAIEEMAQGIYEKTQRNVVPMDKDLKALKKRLAKLTNEYFASERYDESLVRARETIHRLQDQFENGRKKIKGEPKEVPPELANLQDQIWQLRMEIRTDEKLADLNEQLRTGEYVVPVKREKKPVNQRLQRKQTEVMRKRREIIQAIADTAPWTTGKVAKEIVFSLKAVAATADLSFTMRQNLWQVFAHPVLATGIKQKARIIGKKLRGEELKASERFFPALEAFFSEYSADEINNAILHSENAFLYEQAGVAILDANSPDAQQKSEVFRARVIEKIPILGAIMKASSRHAAVISNLMRTSAFDQFLADNPNATQEEMRLMADYINVSTGLGNLGKAGAIGEALQLGLFSPKFSWSRIELPFKMMQVLTNRGQYRNIPTVRKRMAQDLVAVVGTGTMVLALASLAGFDVEWLDPDDPDWGKIRIGNMRIDIWGGFQQPARVIVRMATGAIIRDFNPLEILGRFAAFKFSPAVTVPIEALRGKTAVGEDVTLVETAYITAMPLVARDIQEAWEEHGARGAVAAGALGAIGVGVSTYRDSETATRREIKKLMQQGEYGEAAQLKADWNRENPNDRIVTVK